MRPDKKKARHHDSQKKANAARFKAEQEAKKSAKKEVERRPIPQREQNKQASDILSEPYQEENSKYGKRRVLENWTKYEIPSSDDENGCDLNETQKVMTGEDFNCILQQGGTSESQFRLKAEKEWDESVACFNEFFILDKEKLNMAMSSIPLYNQLNLCREDINDSTYEYLRNVAEKNRSMFDKQYFLGTKQPDVEEIKDKLKICALDSSKYKEAEKDFKNSGETSTIKKEKNKEESDKSGGKDKKEIEDLEDWLDDFLDD